MQIIADETLPRTVRYPWKEWADGKTRRAEHGVDYQIPTPNFQRVARMAAKRMGMDLVSHMDGDSLIFRFSPRGEGGE